MKLLIVLQTACLWLLMTSSLGLHAKASTVRATSSSSTTPTQSYSASAVYPTQVYCPTGQTCAFPAPTIIMSIK